MLPSLFAAGLSPAVECMRSSFSSDANAGSFLQVDNSLDSAIQGHRRKMLRRAANRRSAQLSRARKKAHLEELKNENSRLQRILDVLDSQPEIVFCVTACGKITYISENSMHFVRLRTSGVECDEDPTHINQLLLSESVEDLLILIRQLHSLSAKHPEEQENSLFFNKEVYFYDNTSSKVAGMLRCAKVHRRASLSDLAASSSDHNGSSSTPVLLNHNQSTATTTASPVTTVPTGPSNSKSAPASKRQKVSTKPSSKITNSVAICSNSSKPTDNSNGITPPSPPLATAAIVTSKQEESWNHLSILADCVITSLSNDMNSNSSIASPNIPTGVVATSTFLDPMQQQQHHQSEEGFMIKNSLHHQQSSLEEEFVCVIRIAESAFLPYRLNSNNQSNLYYNNGKNSSTPDLVNILKDGSAHIVAPLPANTAIDDRRIKEDREDRDPVMYYIFTSVHLLSSQHNYHMGNHMHNNNFTNNTAMILSGVSSIPNKNNNTTDGTGATLSSVFYSERSTGATTTTSATNTTTCSSNSNSTSNDASDNSSSSDDCV